METEKYKKSFLYIFSLLLLICSVCSSILLIGLGIFNPTFIQKKNVEVKEKLSDRVGYFEVYNYLNINYNNEIFNGTIHRVDFSSTKKGTQGQYYINFSVERNGELVDETICHPNNTPKKTYYKCDYSYYSSFDYWQNRDKIHYTYDADDLKEMFPFTYGSKGD